MAKIILGKIDTFSLAGAFALVPMLWERNDKDFHHGGQVFVGPAGKEALLPFWNKHHEELTCSDFDLNKKILSAYKFSQYSIYCYYVDDNSWSSGLWKYDDSTKEWDCYIMIDYGDL